MIIYKITNKINNISYIGQTIYSLNDRWKRHLYQIKNNSKVYFHNAIRKYGVENFTIEVLCECDTREILNIMETFKIMVHRTHVSEGGYNLTWGGDDNPMNYQYFRDKISKDNHYLNKFTINKKEEWFKIYRTNIWKGKKSPRTSEMNKKRIGCLNPNYGKHNEKLAEFNRTREYSLEDRRKKSERLSKYYVITLPNNNEIIIKNLSKFCKNNSLSNGTLLSHGKSKGFLCNKIDKNHLLLFEEMVKFYKVANDEDIKRLEKAILKNDWNEFKRIIKDVIGVALH